MKFRDSRAARRIAGSERRIAECPRFLPRLLLAAGLALAGGCRAPAPSGAPPRAGAALRVTAHAGGVHRRTVVHGGRWYQARGAELLVVDPADARVLTRLALAPVGEAGPATDLALANGSLLVVLRDTAVAVVTLADPAEPRLAEIVGAEALGILPRHVRATPEGVVVSGPGGAVCLADRARLFAHEGEVGPVVRSGTGLLTTVGRRVLALADGAYAGSASELLAIPVGTGWPGSFVFVRRGEGGTSVGLMTDHLREIDVREATLSLAEEVHRVRVIEERLWVVTDEAVRAYAWTGRRLEQTTHIPIRGARDVDRLDDGRMALAGVFGRGVVGPDGRWSALVREPAGVERAAFDGRRVIIDGPQGCWSWRPGGAPGEAPREAGFVLPPAAPAPQSAETIRATARIVDEGRGVEVRVAGGEATTWTPATGGRARCLVAVEGAFWIGHDGGIAVLGAGAGAAAEIGTLRLDGPVLFLFPLLEGGGAVYVTRDGGLGRAEIGKD